MTITRRRFLAISAAAGVVGSVATQAEAFRWRGVALGARASITLHGMNRGTAAAIVHQIESEILRLERIFSLYRQDSEISCLNGKGRLDYPSHEMLEVLDLCRLVNRSTRGAFDPTVQPLWQLHARAAVEKRGPSLSELDRVRKRVGWPHVVFGPSVVRFERPGMAVTLNGIAQGYIADRVASLLQSLGLTDVLIDAGETRALGQRPDGAPWQAGISLPDGTLVARISLANRALATSAPLGTLVNPATGTGHILDPRTGMPVLRWRTASVSAPNAALADALSTAFCMMNRRAITTALARHRQTRLEALVA